MTISRLRVSEDITVGELKNKITFVAPDRQILSYDGIELDDDEMKIEELEITDGTVL